MSDETRQRACVRSLEIIGEATKRLDESFRAKHSNIEWRLMAGTRDRVIHDYAGVEYDIVWEILRQKSPTWQTKLESSSTGCRSNLPSTKRGATFEDSTSVLNGSGGGTFIELFSQPSKELFSLLKDGKKLAQGLAD